MGRGDVVGMVLCAGLGTRLRPLTARLPKPAVPVCGLPLVHYTLGLLAGAGVRRAVVNVHHLPGAMAAAAEESARSLGLELAVSREPVIAGTGGALREARVELSGAAAIVVVNGDILFDLDLHLALAAHRASGALATMVVMPMPAGAAYAAVELDPAGVVRRIAGRFGPGGEGLSPWHFTGVHVLAPALIGAGAHVEAGATVGPSAVVGARARIAAGARVAHAVVWEDSALGAGEELVRAVAAGQDRVRAGGAEPTGG